jgi:putative addiction module component (TIGR02574 family)
MTVEQAINDISALPPSDRIQIAQAIWDGLGDHVGTAPEPAIKAELERRWAKYKADPSSALTEEEFRNQIRDARS